MCKGSQRRGKWVWASRGVDCMTILWVQFLFYFRFYFFFILFLHQFNLSSVQLGASAKTEGGHLHNEKGVLKNRGGRTALHADVATLHCQFNCHFFTIN